MAIKTDIFSVSLIIVPAFATVAAFKTIQPFFIKDYCGKHVFDYQVNVSNSASSLCFVECNIHGCACQRGK